MRGGDTKEIDEMERFKKQKRKPCRFGPEKLSKGSIKSPLTLYKYADARNHFNKQTKHNNFFIISQIPKEMPKYGCILYIY